MVKKLLMASLITLFAIGGLAACSQGKGGPGSGPSDSVGKQEQGGSSGGSNAPSTGGGSSSGSENGSAGGSSSGSAGGSSSSSGGSNSSGQ